MFGSIYGKCGEQMGSDTKQISGCQGQWGEEKCE
jgi:hypothetical protein